MSPLRRRWLALLAALAVPARAAVSDAPGAPHAQRTSTATGAPHTADATAAVRRGRALDFPRDHGAHPDARTEWWYATGWLGTPEAPTHGVQITFFRSATGLAAASRSRFGARHVLFAHAAVTDLAAARHHHVQRIARWSGAPDARPDAAALDDASLRLGPWWLRRDGNHWRARVQERGFALEIDAERTQPLLLQGDRGFSRKGRDERQASHYYSEPQLALAAAGRIDERALQGRGRAWLDHEWSAELLHPEAVGWDWIGINLFDGSALTAFRLRRADGSALWAGGSRRAASASSAADARPVRDFAPGEVHLTPGRRWRSAATNADYPVEWQLQTPAGRHGLRALLDAQELAGNAAFGAMYWEGLAELLDEGDRRVGLGYLEMTGYAARLRLG